MTDTPIDEPMSEREWGEINSRALQAESHKLVLDMLAIFGDFPVHRMTPAERKLYHDLLEAKAYGESIGAHKL